MGRDDNTQLMIVGHTDSVGNENYNLGLSVRRAQSAARYLMQQGIDYTRIETEGRGESQPIADNITETGQQENRRIEVAIYASEEYAEELEAAK